MLEPLISKGFFWSDLQFVADAYAEMLSEAANPNQLTHIQHPEDRPLMHGSQGFEHAHAALMHAHDHMKAKKHSSDLTMKYDGSPSLVFGHHPVTKKFFVATKSAFNKRSIIPTRILNGIMVMLRVLSAS